MQGENLLSLQSIVLAADARLGRTELDHDQVWQVILNEASRILLASQYHGLVDHSVIDLSWRVEGLPLKSFARPVELLSFAPSFARLKVGLTHGVDALIDVLVIESEAVGCRYRLTNHDDKPVTLRAELTVDADRKVQVVKQAITPLPNPDNEELYMLSVGLFPNIEPMVILEGAHLHDLDKMMLARDLVIEPQQTIEFRFIHAGEEKKGDSYQLAVHWLNRDWDALIAKVEDAQSAIPTIETGSDEVDQAVALSFQQMLQAIVQHNNEPVLDATRSALPKEGAVGQHPAWNNPQIHYITGLALAYVVPNLSQRIINRIFQSQADDGSIDISLTGDKSRLLCPPILARWVWNTYQITGDLTLIRKAFYPLVSFFNCWTAQDVDVDLDNLPEYQDERQMGYVYFPTFGNGERWSQNAPIQFAETPDMATYLLSEAQALALMAEELGNFAGYELAHHASELKRLLDGLWRDDLNRYAYRDRDTDITSRYIDILPESPVQEQMEIDIDLEKPSRLIFRLVGGASTPPRGAIVVSGLDREGKRVEETLNFADKQWGYGFGTTITEAVFSRIDDIQTEGLSRIFKLAGHTVDYTRFDINALLPLILPNIEPERRQALIDYLKDPAHFNRHSGMTIVSAQDANYDPSSGQGGGGVWSYWLTLIGEGLIASGQVDLAQQFLRSLLTAQVEVLKDKGQFAQFYHAEQPKGLGVKGSIIGVVPIYLLMRLLGIRISKRRVVVIEPVFGWDQAVTFRQHDVTVTRSATSISVQFPSGNHVILKPTDEIQIITDSLTTDEGSDKTINTD